MKLRIQWENQREKSGLYVQVHEKTKTITTAAAAATVTTERAWAKGHMKRKETQTVKFVQ